MSKFMVAFLAALALASSAEVQTVTFQSAWGARPLASDAQHAAIVFRDDEDTLIMDFKNGILDPSGHAAFCAGHRCVISFCEQVTNRCPDLPSWPYSSAIVWGP